MSDASRKLHYLLLSSESDDSETEFSYLMSSIASNLKTKWESLYLRRRGDYGEFHTLFDDLSHDQFKNYFRMTRHQFHELLHKISGYISGCDTNYRRAIGAKEKLAITLRYLATGNSFKSMGYSYRISPRSVSRIVIKVCDAIWTCLKEDVMPDPCPEDFRKVAMDFNSKWNFNNCVGALDGKHVFIKAPPKSGSDFFNYKGRFSIVLLAMVDAEMKFLYVDIGAKGRFSDGGIFSSSFIGSRLKNSKYWPEDQPLYEGGKPMPFVAVGDAAFPLLKHLMRPYPGKQANIDRKKRIYNYRLSRARRVVESAFGILAARWRVFRRAFEIPVEKVDKVVLATCILHNYLMTNKGTIGDYFDESIESEVQRCFGDLQSPNIPTKRECFAIRDEFMEFFNSLEGVVPWQNEIQ